MTTSLCLAVADRRRPRGMTLVELLVVVSLMAGFLALVVVGVRGGTQAQKRGGETLAAMLAAAQARALGVPEGAATILASGSGPETNAADACTSLFDAVMQPLIIAAVSGSLPAVTVSPLNGGNAQRAYKILLQGDTLVTAPPTAWLAYTPVSPTSGTVSFRATLGQTTANTVWPRPIVRGAFTASLAEYPVKSTAVVPLEEGSAVDLRFSGIGDDRSTMYGRLDGKGAIGVVFDRVGRVAEVIQRVPEPGSFVSGTSAQPAIPVGTIYFLVAPRDLIASGSNALASDQATWVALSAQSGRIFIADNVVQSGTDTTALRAARAKARQGIGIGK